MNGFDKRRQQKTDAILQAALELFLTRGVKAVAVADIAKKARVSPVTIYNYFGSKELLAKRVLFEWFDRKMVEAEGFLYKDMPFREMWKAVLSFKMEAANDKTIELIRNVGVGDPDVQRLLEEYYRDKTVPWFMDIIGRGKREGEIDPDLSTEAILLYTGIVQKALSQPEVNAAITTKVSHDLMKLFSYGLLGKPPER